MFEECEAYVRDTIKIYIWWGLSNDNQIRVIGLVSGAWIIHKNAQNFVLSEKLGAKFPVTTHDYSTAHLDYAFSEFFKLEANQVKGQSLRQKDNERRKE